MNIWAYELAASSSENNWGEGDSCMGGFRLKRGNGEVKTAGYARNNPIETSRIAIRFIWILVAFSALNPIFDGRMEGVGGLIVEYSIIGIVALFCNLPERIFFSRLSEYHACEHKAVYALKKHDNISYGDIEKAPMTLFSCGQVLYMIPFEVSLFVGLCITAVTGGSQSSLFAVLAWTGTIFIGSSLALVPIGVLVAIVSEKVLYKKIGRSTESKKRVDNLMDKTMMYSMTPLLIVPFILERIFMLKYPSGDIIHEGVELAKLAKSSN